MNRLHLGLSLAASILVAGPHAHAAFWQGDINNDWFAGTNGVNTNWSDHSFALSGAQTIGNTGSAVVADSTVANAANIALTTFGMAGGANNSTSLTIQANQNFSTSSTFTIAGASNTNGTLLVKDTADLTVASFATSTNAASLATTITLEGSATLSQTAGNSRFSQTAGTGSTTVNLKGSSSTTLSSGGNWWLGEGDQATLNLSESATLTLTGSNTRIQSSRGTAAGSQGTAVINISGGTYNATGVTGTGSDIIDGGNTAGNTGSTTLNITGGTINAFGWQLNSTLETAAVNITGGSSTVAANRITFNKTSSNALQLNSANTTITLNLSSHDTGGVRQLATLASNMLLAGSNLVLNAQPGFAIDAGEFFDVFYGFGTTSLTGIDITGSGGFTSFTDNTGAAFTVSIVSGPGNSGREEWLRLTATQTVLVPEPAALALLGLGTLLIAARRTNAAA